MEEALDLSFDRLLRMMMMTMMMIVAHIRAVLWTYIKTVLHRRQTTIHFLLHPSVYTAKLIEIIVDSFVEEIEHEILQWMYLVKVRDHGRLF